VATASSGGGGQTLKLLAELVIAQAFKQAFKNQVVDRILEMVNIFFSN
jgi:hypothetical protein